MKFLIALLLIPAALYAEDAVVQPSRMQLSHGSDCVGIQISSGTAAQVIAAASGYSYASIENEDGSADAYCAFRANVAASGALRGKHIAAGKEKLFIIAPLLDNIYCITSNAAGAINAMLCRGH